MKRKVQKVTRMEVTVELSQEKILKTIRKYVAETYSDDFYDEGEVTLIGISEEVTELTATVTGEMRS